MFYMPLIVSYLGTKQAIASASDNYRKCFAFMFPPTKIVPVKNELIEK